MMKILICNYLIFWKVEHFKNQICWKHLYFTIFNELNLFQFSRLTHYMRLNRHFGFHIYGFMYLVRNIKSKPLASLNVFFFFLPAQFSKQCSPLILPVNLYSMGFVKNNIKHRHGFGKDKFLIVFYPLFLVNHRLKACRGWLFMFRLWLIEVGFFHRIARQTGDPHRGGWRFLVRFTGEAKSKACLLGSQCLISIHPAMEKVQLCLYQAQYKSHGPKVMCHEFSPVQAVPIQLA